jgi:hypothetical protein
LPLWGRIMHPVGVGIGRLIRCVGGCFLFCTREAHDAAGGFPERLYAGRLPSVRGSVQTCSHSPGRSAAQPVGTYSAPPAVSFLGRTATPSLSASRLRCDAKSASCQPNRSNSSRMIRSALAWATSSRISPKWCSPT